MSNSKNALEDFEAFLEPDFTAKRFANDLLVATNGTDTSEVDLSTPAKKLQFDLHECDKRMKDIAGAHYHELVSNFTKIEQSKRLLDGNIKGGLEHVNTSFHRIHTDVIHPYDEAVKLNGALKKIHHTLELLRGASYFVFLIQQLEELEKDTTKDVVRLAKLHVQVSNFYSNESVSQSKGSVSLLAIKLVREFQAVTTSKRLELNNQCIHVVNNEFNHPSTFVVGNTNLQNNLVALYTLSPNNWHTILERATISKLVQTSTTQLSRALQAPRNFTAIMSETKESSVDYFETLSQILTSCVVPVGNTTSTLMALVLEHFQVERLSDSYWQKVSHKFKKNVAATLARGGPIAKNLKVYSTGIRNSLNDTFKDKYERELLLDAVSIIE